MMTNRGFVLLWIVLLAGSGVVFAQSGPGAEQLYSSGVQAFHSQRYSEAIGFFNKIEDLGTQDPRAFFFRGLSSARLGNVEAATADFEIAARMEWTVAGRSYSVPKALERIQGRERTAIEQYRRAAKRVWEAEQNVRKQEEFLSQKAEDMKFYQSIIASGKSETPSSHDIAVTQVLPFGAQPVTPFAVNQPTFRTRTAANVSPGELSVDNPFRREEAALEQPEDTKPKAQPKPQDPGERGIFDFDNEDDAQGFDVNFQQPGGRSVSSNPFGGLGVSSFGGGDDDFSSMPFGGEPNGMTMSSGGGIGVDPAIGVIGLSSAMSPLNSVSKNLITKENGPSIGKGIASLFKKSGSGGVSSGQPSAAPSNQKSLSDDFDGGDDPFSNPFEE